MQTSSADIVRGLIERTVLTLDRKPVQTRASRQSERGTIVESVARTRDLSQRTKGDAFIEGLVSISCVRGPTCA